MSRTPGAPGTRTAGTRSAGTRSAGTRPAVSGPLVPVAALATVLVPALLTGLAACGSGADTSGTDTTTGPGVDPAGVRVAVVSVTGGARPPRAARAQALTQPRERAAYLGRLPTATRAQAEKAIAGLAVTKGETLYAQLVYVGCHQAAKETVTVTRRGGGVAMASRFREPKDAECYAPVSTIAFAAVPE